MAEQPPRDPVAERYARGRQKDAEARAALEPLRDGERPGAVTVAAILAFALAVANVAAVAAGSDLSGEEGNAAPATVVVTVILLTAGIGMWKVKYWAVLGFQVILGLQILFLSVALLRVERWWFGLAMVVVIGLLGWLFWKLIRAMARIQMPQRPDA
jgi:hypothetical protein